MTVDGLDELLALLQNTIDDMERAPGDVGRKMYDEVLELTPVDTGSMKASWRLTTESLYIDPVARNTRSGVPVTTYAPYVDERYGIVDTTLMVGGRAAIDYLSEVGWNG